MMKRYFKICRNQLGVSAMELIVGVAIFGGIALIVGKNLQNQQESMIQAQQNMAVETSMKLVSDMFKKRTICESILNTINLFYNSFNKLLILMLFIS